MQGLSPAERVRKFSYCVTMPPDRYSVPGAPPSRPPVPPRARTRDGLPSASEPDGLQVASGRSERDGRPQAVPRPPPVGSAGSIAGGHGNPPRVPIPGDDFNIDVDLEPAYGAASLEVAELQAELRRLQRRVAAFEAANAELSAAGDPLALAEIWLRVSTWGFEDSGTEDGVAAFIAEADAHAAARERVEVALGNLLDRIAHLRRIPCRDCVIIPCPTCSEGTPGHEVVRHASLPVDKR